MRNPTFLLASSGALIGTVAMVVAITSAQRTEAPYIAALAGLISLAAARRAMRAFRPVAR